MLKSKEYQEWVGARESRVLGLVGGPGSGKTAVSVFIYTQIRTIASDNAPLILLNCSEISSFTRLQLLHSLVWKLLEQRPDVLLKRMSSKGYYVKLFKEATTFGALWPLFIDIVKPLQEVWTVLDSIHGCVDGRERIITDIRGLIETVGRSTKIKLVLGSRYTSDLTPATNTVFEYSASDMRQASVDYIAHEAAEMGEQGSLLREVTTDIVDTVDRLGGQMVWRGTLLHLVKAATSMSEAQAILARISDPNEVVDTFWSCLLQQSGYSPELLRAIIDVLVSTHGPLTLLQIYDTIRASHPTTLDGISVGALGTLMKDKFSACTSAGYGFSTWIA